MNESAKDGPFGFMNDFWAPFKMMSPGERNNPWHWDEQDFTAFTLGVLLPGGPVGKTPRMKLGQAPHARYRDTFFDRYPHLRDEQLVIHHAIEQQVMRRYPGVLSPGQLHSIENLRGIPAHINGELHLSRIRIEWNRFYDTHPTATLDELLDFARQIDAAVGRNFMPPIGAP